MTACARHPRLARLIESLLLFALVVFFGSAGFASPVQAQQIRAANPYGTEVEFTVGLRDQRTQLGEVSLHISKDGILSISPVALVSALGNRITPAAGGDLLGLTTIDGRTDFAAFRQFGFELVFNDADLDLAVTIPLRARPKRDYSVMGSQSEEIGDFDPAAGFSIAANLRFLGDYSHSEFGSNLNGSATVDILGRAAGIAYQTNFRLSGTNGRLARESSRLIYDDLPHAVRWQIGDVRPFSASTVGGDDILGIGLSRETDTLRPERTARLRATQAFSIAETSEVVVSVNGRVVTRRMFPPGNYNIADFPFVQGRNQVELLIINQAGQQERLSFNQFLDNRLLEGGSDDFGIAIGISSAPGYNGPRTYNPSHLALNAHYIRGVTERLTMGMSTAHNSKRSTFLTTAVYAGRTGATSGRLGFTTDKSEGDIGILGFGVVRALGVTSAMVSSRTVRLGLDGRFDLSGSHRDLFNASIGYAWPVTKTINANLDLRISDRSGSSSIQTSIGLTSQIRLDISFDWRFGGDPTQRGPGVSIGLSRSFGRESQGRARYDSRLNEGRATFTSTPADGLGKWSSSFEAAVSDQTSSLSIAGSSFFNRSEFATQATSNWQNGRTIQRLGVRTGTALAFVNGQFAIGRPVADSFAIIGGHKSLKGRMISLRSQGGEASPMAKTGFFGPALVTGLGTYAPRTITVAVEDPPAGYDIGSGTFRVSPPLFGGYRFVVGSDTANSVIGTLVLANGQAVSLAVGTASSLDWPKTEPIVVFTNANGQFSVSGLGVGRWALNMRGIGALFEFLIEQNETNFVELGIIHARVAP